MRRVRMTARMNAGPRSRMGARVRAWGAVAWGLAGALACGTGSSDAPPAVDDQAEIATTPAQGEAGADAATAEGSSGSSDPGAMALVIAVRAIPTSLDPLTDLDPWATRVVEDAVFEGLTRRSSTGEPWAEPALADACVLHPRAAPRDAYCHLPAGRSFHDGTPVTPDDVVYSLEHWLDPRRSALRSHHGLSALRRVEIVNGPPSGSRVAGGEGEPADEPAPDPGRWIRVSSEVADSLLLERLARMVVVPKAAHKGHTTRFAREPVGTGPMRVAQYDADRIVLERSAEAGEARGTGVDRLVLAQMRDGSAALTGLRRGDVHIVASVSPAHVPVELAKPGMASRFRAWLLTPAVYDLVLYNARRAPTEGPRLRAALDAALPRAEVARAMGGTPPVQLEAPVDLAEPAPVDLSALEAADAAAHAGMAGLPAPLPPGADEAGRGEAEGMLTELGWVMDRGLRRRGTTTLRLVLMWNGDPGIGRTVATAVREAWRAVGVHVPYATASWSYLMGPLRRGDFDLALGRLAESSDADLYPYFHSKGDLNVPGVADTELDAALESYRSARTPEERSSAKEAIAARLSALRVVSVLRAPTEVLVASRRVAGLQFVDDLPVLRGLELLPPQEWELGAP
jgi:ABC-type transport system substrate-binding protein